MLVLSLTTIAFASEESSTLSSDSRLITCPAAIFTLTFWTAEPAKILKYTESETIDEDGSTLKVTFSPDFPPVLSVDTQSEIPDILQSSELVTVTSKFPPSEPLTISFVESETALVSRLSLLSSPQLENIKAAEARTNIYFFIILPIIVCKVYIQETWKKDNKSPVLPVCIRTVPVRDC